MKPIIKAKKNESKDLPWWTWLLPILFCHIGTQFSLKFQITPGVAIWYLPIPIAIVLIHWWGPRVLLGLYVNAVLCAGMWGLKRWYLWPLYAMPEVLEVFLSWILFTRLVKGKCWLPDLQQTLYYLLFGIIFPITIGVVYLIGQLFILGDIQANDFWWALWSKWLSDILAAIALSIPLLIFFTAPLSRKGLAVVDHPEHEKILSACRENRYGWLEAVILFAAALVFSLFIPFEQYWYLCGLLSIYTALRFGMGLTVIINTWIVILTLIIPAMLSGKFGASWTPATNQLNIHIGMLFIYFSGVVIARSISDNLSEIEMRKQTEKTLRESEQRYRGLFDEALDMIHIIDHNGVIMDANQIEINTLAYGRDEFLGKPLVDFIHPDFKEKTKQVLQKILKDNAPIRYDTAFIAKNGNKIDVEVNAVPLIESNKIVSIRSISRDVTEQRQTEEDLKKINTIFDALLENSPIFIFFKDHHIRSIYLSRNYENMLGMPLDKILGKTMDELFPSDIAKAMIEDDKKIILEEQLVQVDEEFNGRNYTTIKFPIHVAGTPTMLAGFTIDITERKKAEEEKVKLVGQLLQSQKMQSIGTLAGGIAHDFNNILSVIIGNISYVLSVLSRDGELFKVLSDVLQGATQAQSLTHQLLTFAKGGEPIKKLCNINQLLEKSAKFVTSGMNSRCEFKLSNDLWRAEIDSGQIEQVISNLLINADQSMPGSGVITIGTENTSIGPDSSFPLPAGRYVQISIEDQGVGISQKLLPKIFDPYFTTKQKGSGLGLATTYSIIKRHGGHIAVYSEPDKGTVFSIYLPASLNNSEETEGLKESSHRGHGRILIMDDQEQILLMIGRMLNKMGYETTFATDGSKAIDLFREAYDSPNPFDLVILDLTVPGGMGGSDTIPELLKINPKAKVVVSSGYSNDPVMSNYEDYGFYGVVPKPYTKDQIAELLNTIFDKKLVIE